MPDGFRAPTVPTGETPIMKKRKYQHVFDKMTITGMIENPRVYKNNRVTKDKNGNELFDLKSLHGDASKLSWVRKNKLSIDSHLFHWLETMLNVRRKEKKCVQWKIFWNGPT